MKREDLQKIEGLTDDQINSIMNLHKDDSNAWTTKFNDQNTQIKTLTADLDKYKAVDIEDLKNAKASYEAEKQKLIDDHTKEINDMKFNSALELAVTGTKTVDPIALKAHLDISKLKYNEETKGIDGLDEQITTIKETHGYLFTSKPTGGSHGNLGGGNTDVSLGGALAENYK